MEVGKGRDEPIDRRWKKKKEEGSKGLCEIYLKKKPSPRPPTPPPPPFAAAPPPPPPSAAAPPHRLLPSSSTAVPYRRGNRHPLRLKRARSSSLAHQLCYPSKVAPPHTADHRGRPCCLAPPLCRTPRRLR
ncbi:hypothetical protein DAI22_01g459750 [Oryza sativa Japonica Group]|nr:hypothetical protein DAI22_01g459750 [Oryza sativa Japonica Group]